MCWNTSNTRTEEEYRRIVSICLSGESLSRSELDAILILHRSRLVALVPYKKVGKNRYRRGGKTYSLKQVQAIHFEKVRKKARKKR